MRFRLLRPFSTLRFYFFCCRRFRVCERLCGMVRKGFVTRDAPLGLVSAGLGREYLFFGHSCGGLQYEFWSAPFFAVIGKSFAVWRNNLSSKHSHATGQTHPKRRDFFSPMGKKRTALGGAPPTAANPEHGGGGGRKKKRRPHKIQSGIEAHTPRQQRHRSWIVYRSRYCARF